jgi:hypothetical protein
MTQWSMRISLCRTSVAGLNDIDWVSIKESQRNGLGNQLGLWLVFQLCQLLKAKITIVSRSKN